jgi:hypothetical protein
MNSLQTLFSCTQAEVDINQLSQAMAMPHSHGKLKRLAKGLTTTFAMTAALSVSATVTDFDTVRVLDQSFSMTKSHNILWIGRDVKNWLNQNCSVMAATEMDALRSLVRNIFGNVNVSTKIYNDPDESWSKVQVQIDSQLDENFDRQLALEDKLFAEIWKSASLKELSQHLIISLT